MQVIFLSQFGKSQIIIIIRYIGAVQDGGETTTSRVAHVHVHQTDFSGSLVLVKGVFEILPLVRTTYRSLSSLAQK